MVNLDPSTLYRVCVGLISRVNITSNQIAPIFNIFFLKLSYYGNLLDVGFLPQIPYKIGVEINQERPILLVT